MTGSAPERVPVTLLAGFLGAGKTTLVRRILSERHGERIAVIVNEYGEIGIDGSLVVGVADEVVELSNGCLCCTVRGDLSRTIGELLDARRRRLLARRFDRILIEASGLASPGPIAQTLVVDPRLAAETRLDGIVTLTHAARVVEQLAERPEAGEQIAYADLLVLNHADRADEPTLAAAERELRARNALAPLRRAVRAGLEVAPLLTLRASEARSWELAPHAHGEHDAPAVATVSLRGAEELDLHKLKLWLQFLANRRGQELYRIKGILRCADHEAPVVVQGVYQWLELGPGEGSAPAESVLVLIGRDLDRAELQRGWEACRAG